MPKLLYASASPYSAKVRMAAAYAGVPLDAGDRRHQPAAGRADRGQSARQDPDAAHRRRRRRLRQPRDHPAPQPRVRQRAVPAQRRQARRGRAAGGAGRRHLRLPARPCLRAPQAARGKVAPALARQAVGARSRAALDHLNANPPKLPQQDRRPATSRCAPRSATSTCDFPGNGNAGARSSSAGRRASTRNFRSWKALSAVL